MTSYIGYFALFIFIASSVYVHYRGKVRHSFRRQLTSHTNLTAPYNTFVYLFSKVPDTPYIPAEKYYPELKLLEDNWETIRDEALALHKAENIKASDKIDDVAFNSFFRTGWGRYYLKWYDDYLPSALQHCPKTVELVKQLPNLKAVMFASLPPGAKLTAHRDPYAGSLRYHLGLITPNSEDCNILVDGEKYFWKDGEGVIFDETYIHEAVNNTDEQRIILFCDIHRPMKFKWADALNNWMSDNLVKASTTKNEEGEKVGLINKAFGQLYKLRVIGKSIKTWNRQVYYAVKYFVFFGLVYVIFL